MDLNWLMWRLHEGWRLFAKVVQILVVVSKKSLWKVTVCIYVIYKNVYLARFLKTLPPKGPFASNVFSFFFSFVFGFFLSHKVVQSSHYKNLECNHCFSSLLLLSVFFVTVILEVNWLKKQTFDTFSIEWLQINFCYTEASSLPFHTDWLETDEHQRSEGGGNNL